MLRKNFVNELHLELENKKTFNILSLLLPDFIKDKFLQGVFDL